MSLKLTHVQCRPPASVTLIFKGPVPQFGFRKRPWGSWGLRGSQLPPPEPRVPVAVRQALCGEPPCKALPHHGPLSCCSSDSNAAMRMLRLSPLLGPGGVYTGSLHWPCSVHSIPFCTLFNPSQPGPQRHWCRQSHPPRRVGCACELLLSSGTPGTH